MTRKGIIYQWRVPDGQLLKRFSLAMPGSEVLAIAYSPTGDTVVTANRDYMIRIWQTEDGQLLHKLRGHSGLVNALAYAPTSNMLASASYRDNMICFWNVATGQLLRKIDNGRVPQYLAFSADSLYLVSGNRRRSYVWRSTDGKLLQIIRQKYDDRSGVQWHPSGQMLVYGLSHQVVVRELEGEPLEIFEYGDHFFGGITWHPDGKQIAVGTKKGMIPIFTLGEKTPTYLCEAHTKWVWSLAYTPDGRFLASSGIDGNVFLWAFDSSSLPTTIFSRHRLQQMVQNRLSGNEDSTFNLFEISLHSQTEVKPQQGYVEAAHELDLPHLICEGSGKICTVGYSIDGKELLAINKDGMLYRWRIEDGQLIKKQALLAGENQLTCAMISPDGQTIAVASQNLMIFIWRLKDGKLLHQLPGHTNEVKALAYTPDSQVLASSGGENEMIHLWNIAEGKHLHTIPEKKLINCLEFSPSGSYLACGSSSHRYDPHSCIHIWDTKAHQWRYDIQKGSHTEHDISWSSDEQFLLCGDGGDIYMWRVADGQEMICFKGHWKDVNAVVWHPTYPLLLSAGADKTVRVWSPVAPHLRHVGEGHKGRVRCLAVSPDGHTFASGGGYGTVRLWFLPKVYSSDDFGRSLANDQASMLFFS